MSMPAGFEASPAGWLVVLGILLFWAGMLGLLWRRSLVGMLVGILIAWLSVAVVGVGFAIFPESAQARAQGGAWVVCVAIISVLQVCVGLGIVVARIRRRGTLDADDAGLLEG